MAIEPSFERFREVCHLVSAYYLLERYPSAEEVVIDAAEVRQSLELAQELIESIRAALR